MSKVFSNYEAFMTDASEKRMQKSKAVTDKETAMAETETQLQTETDTKKTK